MGAHSNAKIELLYRRNSLRTIIKNYDDENLGRALSAALLATASSVTERSVAAGRIDPSAFSLSTLDGPQDSTVDRMSIASLLALGEVAETLPEVFARRREVQARRTRADSDIAQLFRPQYPQVPWYSTATGYQIFESFGLAELFESAPRRILVVSPDVLPYPGLATVGSGLRAWGLGQGLISRGHDVVFSMPRAAAEKHRALITDEIFANSWPFFGISDIVQRVAPDVVLVVGWALAAHLVVEREAPDRVPIVIDQHGPHILERRFQQLGDSRQNADEKIEALKKADYFTCAGGKQATYFADWLGSAAWDDEEIAERSAALPFSLSPELPTHEPRDELTFVFGGVFLPWQDPTAGLHQLAAEMARRRRGRLMIFGGRHQLYDIEEGPIADALRSLRDHPYVAVSPAIPHDELIEEYRRAHVAIDLMRRNPERELAFTSRTVEYLWCGLPVIYNDYAELADYIRRYEAGWTVDPDDPEALAEVLTQIFESPELVAERGRNAQELVRAELTWDKTIGPLDAFVRRATLRRPHPVAVPGGTPSASEATFASGPPVPEVVTRTVVRLHRTLPPGVRHAMRRGLGALVGEHTPRNRNGLPVEVIAAVERLRRLTSRAAQ